MLRAPASDYPPLDESALTSPAPWSRENHASGRNLAVPLSPMKVLPSIGKPDLQPGLALAPSPQP